MIRDQDVRAWRLSIEYADIKLGEFNWPFVLGKLLDERDEILAVVQEHLPEAIGHNTLPEIVGGIARQRDAQHELKDHLAETARKLTKERDEYRRKWIRALPGDD